MLANAFEPKKTTLLVPQKNRTGRLYLSGRAPGEADQLNEPKLLTGLLDEQVVMASCGARHTALVLGGGQVATCGDGAHGKLGHISTSLASGGVLIEPLPVAALLGVRAKGIACGNDFSLVLGEEGELHSFGDNRAGQLGRPSETPGEPSDGAPALVQGLEGLRVRMVSGGATHALAIAEEGGAVASPEEDGALYSWGGGGGAAWSAVARSQRPKHKLALASSRLDVALIA